MHSFVLNQNHACCREGKLQDAMSCLEEVYNDCAAESKAKNQLDLMLDVGKWSNGMERLCDNIDCESTYNRFGTEPLSP